MPDKNKQDSDCGCCAGVDAETPRRVTNPPGLAAIAYRTGTHARFRESLLARLSSSDYPALRNISTRDEGDFSIALCDAAATTLDVLTFYQERIANENYLRTATERLSVLEMAKLIGYQLAPGVAASTWLAFSLRETPGMDTQSVAPVTIPIGTRVQSVPGQEQQAQTFETIEEAEARVSWNAIAVQTKVSWRPRHGDTDLYLHGVNTRLEPGDGILIVGKERIDDAASERWDVRILESVLADTDNNRTRVTWRDGLGHISPRVEPAEQAVQVFAFRKRAALFGHNAPNPTVMSEGDSNLGALIEEVTCPDEAASSTNQCREWKHFNIATTHIDLDTEYPKVGENSWTVLVSNQPGFGTPSLPGYVELYRGKQVLHVSRADFGISAKITRIIPDGVEHLDTSTFGIRETLVLTQSEELATVPRPLLYPFYGVKVPLASRVEGLMSKQALAFSGKRQRISIAPGVNNLDIRYDKDEVGTLTEGDSLILAEAPMRKSGQQRIYIPPRELGPDLNPNLLLELKVHDRDGRLATVEARARQIVFSDAFKDDPVVREIAFIKGDSTGLEHDRDRTTLTLSGKLKYCYQRSTVRINANVAPATHGESVKEMLGSGDAARADQHLRLAQTPLTYVSANTPSGRASTLSLRANDLLWHEAPTLYGHEADERIYSLSRDDAGYTTVRFGDGIEGARPPSGENNLRVEYRKGLGVDGNVDAGSLTTLLSRPLGVSEVLNPEAASGGEDAETLARARDNAPLTVLTLDRAVSIKDYADFARAFAGVDKAHALWIPAGPARGVFITVAGVNGAVLVETDTTYRNLLNALRTYGDPLVPLHLLNYRPAAFHLRMSVKVAPEYEHDKVLPAVESALTDAFNFEHRDFGQDVTVDEVVAIAHTVVGVKAVHVIELFRDEAGAAPARESRLSAALPVASLNEIPDAAELLTLNGTTLNVELMP